VITTKKSGTYYRVCDPLWSNCCDSSFSERSGGRWNPPDAFPVLYLNATIETARANAQKVYDGEAYGLFDLNPVARPHLQVVNLVASNPVDAISLEGLHALGLPGSYPDGIGHDRCQPIGVAVHRAGHIGIACRSAAGPNGEELALFKDGLVTQRQRLSFDDWFFIEQKTEIT